MAAITTFLVEDLEVKKVDNWPGPDITGVPASVDTNPPVRQHIVLEKGYPNQDGYARFEFIGAMSGEDWFLLIENIGDLVDLNIQAPA